MGVTASKLRCSVRREVEKALALLFALLGSLVLVALFLLPVCVPVSETSFVAANQRLIQV